MSDMTHNALSFQYSKIQNVLNVDTRKKEKKSEKKENSTYPLYKYQETNVKCMSE